MEVLKKSAGAQKCYAHRDTPGVGYFSNYHWNGVPYTTVSTLNNLAPPGQFFVGAKLFPGIPWMRKNVPQKQTHFRYVKMHGYHGNS